MSAREIAAWGALGALVGLGLALATAPEAQAPEALAPAADAPAGDRRDEAAPRAAACPEPDPAIAEALEGIAEERARLELATALLEGQNAAAEGGAPLQWPDDLDPALSPEAVEADVERLAAEHGAEILHLDCGEYPCLAVIATVGDEAAEPDTRARGQALRDALREGRGDARHSSGMASADDRVAFFYTYALGGPLDADQAARVQWRMEDATEHAALGQLLRAED